MNHITDKEYTDMELFDIYIEYVDELYSYCQNTEDQKLFVQTMNGNVELIEYYIYKSPYFKDRFTLYGKTAYDDKICLSSNYVVKNEKELEYRLKKNLCIRNVSGKKDKKIIEKIQNKIIEKYNLNDIN